MDMRFGVFDRLGIATRCGWFGRPSYRWERSLLCIIFRSSFHMGIWLDISQGAPDPGMPELRWPHTAGDSAGSPLHHDEEEIRVGKYRFFTAGVVLFFSAALILVSITILKREYFPVLCFHDLCWTLLLFEQAHGIFYCITLVFCSNTFWILNWLALNRFVIRQNTGQMCI